MRDRDSYGLLEDTLDAGLQRPNRDRDPSRIARFVVLERIGSGAMGAVFAAFDQQLDRKVAIKLLHPEQIEARHRLMREAQAMAKLAHPNVVTVYEVGTHDEQVFLAMELVRGVTLRRWRDVRPRSLAAIVDVFVQAGEGLAAAHAAGLVHRDFKPDNVLVGDDGRVRVVDFGLARPGGKSRPLRRTAIPGAIARQSVLVDDLTRDGELVGTPAYMAPEVYEGEVADARSDQFSFCVALFETLYGKRPFTGNTVAEVGAAVMAGDFATMAGGPIGADRMRKLLERGLDTDPSRRFPDMHALLDAIRPKRRRRAWLPAATLAVVAVPVAIWIGTRDTKGVPACDELPSPIAAWTDDARTDLAARIDAQREPGASRAAVHAIDDYAQSWADAHAVACDADPRAEPETMKRVTVERSCIASRGRELASLLHAIANADESLLPGAHRAVLALHPLRRCQDPQIAAAMLPAPGDDAVLDAAMRVRLQLGLAWAMNDLGDPREAHRVAREARLAAADVADRSLQAHALFVLSYITWTTGRTGESAAIGEEALIAADAASDQHRRGLTLAWLAIIALLDSRLDDAAAQERSARAVFESFGEDEELEAWLAFWAGTHPNTPQDERLAAMARALELFTRIAGPQSQEVVGTQHNLGDALLSLHRLDDAFTHADARRRALEQLYGPTSVHLAYEYSQLVQICILKDDLACARQWCDKAQAVAEAQGDAAHRIWVSVLQLRAQLEQAAGDYEAALATYVEAERHAAAGVDDPEGVARLRMLHGLVLVRLGRATEALQAFEDAEAGLAERLNRRDLQEHPVFVELVQGWTWAALDADDRELATELAERVPKAKRQGATWAYLEARLSEDPVRMRAAIEAIDAAAPSPGLDADLLATARAWLATR
jgi:tetratricopeptide (TPR) repeat protein